MRNLVGKIWHTGRRMTKRQAMNTAANVLETKMQFPVLRSLPQTVDIVLTRECNLECLFCKNYESVGARRISVENFEKAAEQLFPKARNVSICSGGEPYLHKQLIELLRIARRHGVETWVLSNGMLLKEDTIRTIVREELISRHGFSVDGITPRTVEAIRVGAKLKVILENIKTLRRIRDEEGKKIPSITICYALMRCNIEELPDAVRYWGEMGIETMACSYVSVCNDISPQESLYFHQALVKQVFEKAIASARQYSSLTLSLPPAISQQQPLQSNPEKCPMPWRFVRIEPDGRVLPCYKSWGTIDMGNVFDEDCRSFIDIWNSSQYQALRRTVNSDSVGRLFSYCSVCPRRFGMASPQAHLEDETWLKYASMSTPGRAGLVAHRCRGSKKLSSKGS